jgi:hypothetical protein
MGTAHRLRSLDRRRNDAVSQNTLLIGRFRALNFPNRYTAYLTVQHVPRRYPRDARELRPVAAGEE